MSRIGEQSPPKALFDSIMRDSHPFGVPEGELETILSKLYFLPDTVYKWYKPVKAYYGNLANADERREFYADDFAWNRMLNPEVYEELLGLQYAAGRMTIVPLAEAEDYVIHMRRIPEITTMSDMLLADSATEDDMGSAVELLLRAQERLNLDMLPPLDDVRRRGLTSLYHEYLQDLRNQLHRAADHLSTAQADEGIDWLIALSDVLPYFQKFPTSALVASLDCHTDNIVRTTAKELMIIDSMFPKRNWRVIDELHSIARLATNATVLGSPKKGEEVYHAYRVLRGDFDEHAAKAHEVRTALMQWSRRHLLGYHELAEQFKEHAFRLLAELELAIAKKH